MIGAIIGDILGSKYEENNLKSKEFPLFSKGLYFTDDSVMTIAIGKTLLECNNDYSKISELTVKNMKELSMKYLTAGYGLSFLNWVFRTNSKPYNSFGNGSAMRVSACGWVGKNLEEVKQLSQKITEVTHNHPEGIKGAEATAVAIFLARKRKKINEIKQYIVENYYDINFTLDEIRDSYEFDSSCQGSVPQALEAFFESVSFEDTIRNAISIGGDTDTICAIAGSIAHAYFGIPKDIEKKALSYLDNYLLEILKKFEEKYLY